MWNAVINSNIGDIESLIAARFPIDEPLNSLGMTALHFACTNENFNVLIKLLKFKADPNHPDLMGRTPLHIAAGSGNHNAIFILL